MSILTRLKEKAFKYSLKEFYEYMEMLEDGVNGDLVLSVTPATTGTSAAEVTGSYTRDVAVKLVDADGNIHRWFNGTFAIAVADVTAGDGSSAIEDSATTVQLTEGVGSVTIEYSNTWAEADTNTLTVTGGTLLGYTIANKTSVDTLVA